MHVPDGFLDAKTLITTALLSAAGVGMAIGQAQRHLPRRKIPLLGLAGAFVFAAQMLNFPVAGGTSGHLVGGVLAAVLLGPGAAVIVLAAVLLVQCFMFADGGVLALGANIFNMGIVGTVGGYGVYWLVCKLMIRPTPAAKAVTDASAILKYATRERTGPIHPAELRVRLIAAAFAAWCGVVLASIACAGELALSHTARWNLVFPAMANIHMLIGIGEGVITALVLAAVGKARPELLERGIEDDRGRGYWPVVMYGLLIALGLAMFVSPLASKWPDGLEKVAGMFGFEHKAAEALLPAPMADYSISRIPWATAATSIAGAVGTVLMFALATIIARLLTRQPAASPAEESAAPRR
jgi:cobalt/nickel transport system permease protein